MNRPIPRWIRPGVRLGSRTRVLLARRPWLVWAGVLVATLVLAGLARRPAADAAAAKAQWGATRPVLVATAPVATGTPARQAALRIRSLPAALVPANALAEAAPDAVVVRALQAGEIVVPADLGTGDSRFALVPAGHVVVALPRPPALVPARPGDRVLVAGALLGGETIPAVVVDVSPTVVLLAVAADRAPALAVGALASSDPLAIVLQGGPATVDSP